jgi:hypothetical protein
MFNSLGRVLTVVVVLIVLASVSRAPRVAVQASGQGEVLRACEAALWKQTFDDATAAG